MYTLENRAYFSCTKEEKEKLIPVIGAIVELAMIVRTQGMLALEARIAQIPDYFMRAGLRLLTEGTDPELVNAILEVHMVASDKTGAPLLQQQIVKAGLLSIQAGEAPWYTKQILYAYLGEDFAGLADANGEGLSLDAEGGR